MKLTITDPSEEAYAGYWSIEYTNDEGEVEADVHLSDDLVDKASDPEFFRFLAGLTEGIEESGHV